VLLLGETGVGKELFATHLHEMSVRRARPMVRVNCSAIPSTLIESELFGREKGAFTGSLARQIGRFELADRSTIFLDEIGDLPSDVQVKFCDARRSQIERLGSPTGICVDVRIVAATHRSWKSALPTERFAELVLSAEHSRSGPAASRAQRTFRPWCGCSSTSFRRVRQTD
jgi:transcriptional regulator with GAF, ATPase, and Fis domain